MNRESNYWKGVSRRKFLAASGAGTVGAAMLLAGACGDDNSSGSKTTASGGGGTSSRTQPAASPSASVTPKRGGTLIEGDLVGSTFGSQDPHSTPNGLTISPKVYNYLFRSAGEQAPDIPKMPDLAKSYELAPDNVTLIFHLRDDCKIAPNAKGVPERALDSDDVLQNWKRIADPATGANNLGFYTDHVASIDAPDPATFRMVLKTPYAFALDEICHHAGGTIAPKEILGNSDLHTQPVGAGPYRQTELVDGAHCKLERNPNYFKPGQPYLDTWMMQMYPDIVTARTAFQTGGTDIYSAQDKDEASAILKARSGVKLQSYSGAFYQGFWMNVRGAPWKDDRVRHAVSLATNPAEYISLVGHGQGDPTGALERSFTEYVLPEKEVAQLQPYDVSSAKKLFKEAGVSSFSMQYSSAYSDYVNVFVRQLGQAGVTVKAEAQDSGTWVSNFYANSLTSTFFLHNVYDSPDFALAWYMTKGVIGAGKYDTGFSDPAIDKALASAVGTLDKKKRIQAYQDAERLILKSSPALVNVFTGYANRLLANSVQGYPSGPGTRLNVYCDAVWKS